MLLKTFSCLLTVISTQLLSQCLTVSRLESNFCSSYQYQGRNWIKRRRSLLLKQLISFIQLLGQCFLTPNCNINSAAESMSYSFEACKQLLPFTSVISSEGNGKRRRRLLLKHLILFIQLWVNAYCLLTEISTQYFIFLLISGQLLENKKIGFLLLSWSTKRIT